MIKLTIITATFNVLKSGRKSMLRRCIDSVWRVGISHEHIIVDGASDDGTVEFINSLHKSVNALRIISESDSGVYDAFNKGVRCAKGEYVYFLGSDDYICDENAICRALQKCSYADLITSPVISQGEGAINQRTLLYKHPGPHQGIIMRTSIVKKLNGFNTQYLYAADYDLILRAYLSGISTAVYNHPYAYYDNGGMSSIHYDVTFRECTQIAARLLGLSEDERTYLEKKRILPWRIIIQSILNLDPVIRKSALHQLLRFALNCLGLLDARGCFKKKAWV